MEEQKINIDLVPAKQIMEEQDMIRISMDGNPCVMGWGFTLQDAIKQFDERLIQYQK